ncbi:SAM dependent carboxyl methyltransferase [Cynara cardunculus var. scolymus]|uniref:SAM dependent carboxyl methyltransferase n=1 Tax=Cynara cardunculus var. scolymus TaxID=59895 RepID=A0A118K1Q0_CYNCS|nr:SAM dependent carboxyl methyltransferase [Cynara cardunculus var. scolymus]
MDVKEVFHMNGGLGENSYAQNSSLQKKASDMVKHITLESLEETYVSMKPKSIGIADLGCSCGQNTLSTIRELVEVVDETTRKFLNIPPPEYRIYLNDLPTNDFNAIFKILPDFYTELNNERHRRGHKFDSSVFIAGYPGTFYGRLFPNKCLHFIYSSFSLHWLSRVPPGLYDKQGKSINNGSLYISKSSPLEVSKAYFEQFQEDFSLFLRSRSKELIVGGRMVLILLGRRDRSHGDVTQEKVDQYDTHFYAPSKNELEEEVKKETSFEIDRFEMFEIERNSKACMSHGTVVARAVRAIQESMISHHFGEEILDNLFETYGRMIDEEMVVEDIRPVSFIIVLRKL